MPTHYQKLIRRMNTKASDTLMPDDDVRLVVNAEYDSDLGGIKKSKGYTQVGDQMSAFASSLIDTDTEWDAGTHTNTEANSDILQLQGGTLAQDDYDDSYIMYGANHIAMKFSALGPSVTRIGAYLDSVEQTAVETYDDFEDGSDNTSKWDYSGTYVETGGKLIVGKKDGSGSSGNVLNDNDTAANIGYEWGQTWDAGGSEGPDVYCQVRDDTAGGQVEARSQHAVNTTVVSGTGNWSGSYTVNSKSCTVKVIKESGSAKVYVNGTLRFTAGTISASTLGFRAVSEGGSGTNFNVQVSYVNQFYDPTALSDITYEIHEDSSNEPSGSAITNGSGTIASGDVSDTVALIEDALASAATTTAGSDYWLVLSQTGGDQYTYYRVYKKNSDAYASGNILISSDTGSTWEADPDNSGTTDMAFRVYFGYSTSGNWLSDTQTLSIGQTLNQLRLKYQDISTTEKITQVDITNTSGIVQSSYTTDITTGTETTLRSSDFDSGFSYTNGNDFKVKLTLASSGGAQTPGIKSLSVDTPETKIQELKPLYQGASGTKTLLAVIAGTVKRLVSGTWTNLKDDLTSGLQGQATTFRASKAEVVESGTADSGDSTSLTDTPSPEPGTNEYQGYFLKITGGTGVGQVRVIQYHTGTSTSTSTSTTTTTTTSTTTTTTTSTSTTTTTSTSTT